MRKELSLDGFNEVSNEELVTLDGGIVFTAAFVGACVIWTVNAAILTYGVRMATDK